MNDTTQSAESDQAGFGLIEIVVSMFMLALIAITLLPLLIQGIQASAKNATIAAATQLVNQQIEQARSSATTCAGLRTYGLATVATVTDPRGVVLQPVRSVGNCPTTFPGTVAFTSSVKQGTTVLSTATTIILVTS